jgi:thymidylate synthase (FAD)
MKIIKPRVTLEEDIERFAILKKIERAGRTCYKSEANITVQSASDFVRKIIKSGHDSVIEHHSISFRIVCDRGVTHEIVRHRLASYSQESTRYCDYEGEIQFIDIRDVSGGLTDDQRKEWESAMQYAEGAYNRLRASGLAPQLARNVLPNSLKTEIVMTANLREWRHFLKLRTSKQSHPQMREVAIMIYNILVVFLPEVFDDIKIG